MNCPELVDSHIHLTDFKEGTDIAALIERAAEAGVTRLVCNGTSEKDWTKVLDLSKEHTQVIPFLGLHPRFTAERSERWLTVLENLIRENRCGIGETGLEKLPESPDKSIQEESFLEQLDLARKYVRPITIHCVKAWGWLMDILRGEPKLPCGMLIHAYSGSADLIKPLADMGAYFSFSGKVLDPKYERARKALFMVPSDRILIETDAPSKINTLFSFLRGEHDSFGEADSESVHAAIPNMLPPEPFRADIVLKTSGQIPNSPVNLPLIAHGIADLLGEDPESFISRLWENAKRFFGPVMNITRIIS